MGLDMYLRANEYVSRFDYTPDYDRKENPLFMEIVNQFGVADSIDNDGFAGLQVAFPMGYWRKANQIHTWFVENVQGGEDNCGTYFVGRDTLEELRDLILEVTADHSKAEDLLPVGMGFFFGNYDYDEWYMQDMKNTVDQIDAILSEIPEDSSPWTTSFYYRASW